MQKFPAFVFFCLLLSDDKQKIDKDSVFSCVYFIIPKYLSLSYFMHILYTPWLLCQDSVTSVFPPKSLDWNHFNSVHNLYPALCRCLFLDLQFWVHFKICKLRFRFKKDIVRISVEKDISTISLHQVLYEKEEKRNN